MGNIIWRKNFDIQRVDFNLPVETMPGFGGLNFLTVEKNVISKVIWIIKDTNNFATYFPKQELREIIELTIKAILENPNKVDKIHHQTTKLNKQYFDYAKTLRKLNLPKMTNKQLLDFRRKLFDLQYLSHCWALPTTWFVDSDGEDLSKILIRLIDKRIKEARLNLETPTVFSILTSPVKTSLGQQEEMESLKILNWIKKTPKLKHWFAGHTTEELFSLFPTLPFLWKQKIIRHFNKWRWMPYTYIGPAYKLDYYLEVWRGLIHEDIDPQREAKNKQAKVVNIQKQRKQIIRQLNLTAAEKHWFNIAADIVWLKGYRKDCFFHGFFVLDLILSEIGKRSGLSLMQAKYLLPGELPKILSGKNFANIANERMKFSIITCQTQMKNPRNLLKGWIERGIKVYTGQKAKNFLKKQKFEKIKIVQTNELTGTCACPGAATGIIKIINVPDEMYKMNQGDIMLSHTTFPALAPAMKKAAAIITEDGGITCHAAIVARELQTPCVVGCKNAIAILKDGDVVEVDANKGIVKKI